MTTYFIPISLMVLAAFALGLLVGRLAWRSSAPSRPTPVRNQRTVDSAASSKVDGNPTLASDGDDTSSSGDDDSVPERLSIEGVPVWHMEEVKPERADNQPDQPNNLRRFRL